MSNLISVLAIAVVIFAICRELMCWYWKINEHLENQRQIIEKLENLNKLHKRLLTYIEKNTVKKD